MTKRKLAQISGATLGYIHGNARGAYIGYKLGGQMYDKLTQMAPIGSSRSRSRGRPKQRTSSTYRNSSAMSLDTPIKPMKRKSRARSVSRKIVAFNPEGLHTKGIRKGKSVKKEGRKRPVRVGKSFRKKVKAVLTQKGPIGKFREIVPQGILKPGDNEQRQDIISPRTWDSVTGWQFTPTYIAYVYAALYNKYILPGSPYLNVGLSSLPGADPNMEIHVKEQYYVARFKNNSARTYTLKLWDISPKSIQETAYNMVDYLTSELTRTFNAGTEAAENPLNINRTVIGFKPTMLTSFRKNFSLDETIVTLEPGKEYTHRVNGPNDKIYKFNSFYRNGAYYSIQKFCKMTLANYYVDLVGTSLGAPGRYTDIVTADPYGIICETTHYTTIKCPDQTGFNVGLPATGTVQNLTQVGYTFAIKNWTNTVQNGTVVDFEDENPQAPATQGV